MGMKGVRTVAEDTEQETDVLSQARGFPLVRVLTGGVEANDAIFADTAVHVDEVAYGRGHCGCIRRPVSDWGAFATGARLGCARVGGGGRQARRRPWFQQVGPPDQGGDAAEGVTGRRQDSRAVRGLVESTYERIRTAEGLAGRDVKPPMAGERGDPAEDVATRSRQRDRCWDPRTRAEDGSL